MVGSGGLLNPFQIYADGHLFDNCGSPPFAGGITGYSKFYLLDFFIVNY
jgi:hypothetical protein